MSVSSLSPNCNEDSDTYINNRDSWLGTSDIVTEIISLEILQGYKKGYLNGNHESCTCSELHSLN